MQRFPAWLAPLLLLLLGACGGDDDNKACPDVDFDSPDSNPADVQSGSKTKISFAVTSGTPSADCPIQASLSCNQETTQLEVRPGGPGFEIETVVSCPGASAPVNCSLSYSYESPGNVHVGGGSGPTCTP